MTKPKTETKRKYVVTLSVETAAKLTKTAVKNRIRESLVAEFDFDDAKIRVRTVDFD